MYTNFVCVFLSLQISKAKNQKEKINHSRRRQHVPQSHSDGRSWMQQQQKMPFTWNVFFCARVFFFGRPHHEQRYLVIP